MYKLIETEKFGPNFISDNSLSASYNSLVCTWSGTRKFSKSIYIKKDLYFV